MGDYGYGDSDNDAWHFNAMVDYHFNDWGSAFIGYRYMKFDYASSGYSYDAEQQGPCWVYPFIGNGRTNLLRMKEEV